jgi:hypothetical protein
MVTAKITSQPYEAITRIGFNLVLIPFILGISSFNLPSIQKYPKILEYFINFALVVLIVTKLVFELKLDADGKRESQIFHQVLLENQYAQTKSEWDRFSMIVSGICLCFPLLNQNPNIFWMK